MIKIKNITMKNFMSIGAVTQAVSFESKNLTLVLGNNVDLGGDGSRNGVGKTSLINAISFVLYDKALTQIRKDNLVNNTNNKHMIVTCDFEKNGTSYRIERGRKPASFRFFVNGDSNMSEEETDDAQGENRITQHEIEKVIGMSHDMFKHIVALNTYTTPFLSEKTPFQRDLVEELFGISQLSAKAETLKERIKLTRDSIRDEEYKIKAAEDSNERIQKTINDLKKRQKLWHRQTHEKRESLQSQIRELENIDIELELQRHQDLKNYKQRKTEIETLKAEKVRLEKSLPNLEKNLVKLDSEIKATKEHRCYACGSPLHDEKHEQLLESKNEMLESTAEQYESTTKQIEEITEALNSLGDLGEKPSTHYREESDAYNHQSQLDQVKNSLETIDQTEDPYQAQIDSLETEGLREISWDDLNTYKSLQDHQEFLHKLLTNKDSFIRKKIIEQNIPYLNSQLSNYLNKLGLPHEIEFRSDLSVGITELGRDLDFDNLSRGERSRLILGLSWAFRDVHESLNNSINLLLVDELMDNGLDPNGVEAAIGLLKNFTRERDKNVFLISHREELFGRVNNVLEVTKENGFTEFHQSEIDHEESVNSETD